MEMTFIKIYLPVFCILISSSALGDSVVPRYEVVIKGVLEKETFLGPPGFGETPKIDQPTVVSVILVDHADFPSGSGLDTKLKKGSKIQVFLKGSTLDQKKYNRCVVAGGKLRIALAPAEFTDMILNANSIEDSADLCGK
jgi:hypothetical protein